MPPEAATSPLGPKVLICTWEEILTAVAKQDVLQLEDGRMRLFQVSLSIYVFAGKAKKRIPSKPAMHHGCSMLQHSEYRAVQGFLGSECSKV